MKKSIACIIIVLMALFTLNSFAYAQTQEATNAAYELYNKGLFGGTGTDAKGNPTFELDRVPTRQEAITVLVNLLGKSDEARDGSWNMPFNDVDNWAKPYVGYAYNNGLASGISSNKFGGNQGVTASQYITYVLRALGYEVGVDFKWDKAWELSDRIGLTDGRYNENTKTFLRGDVVIISERALYTNIKGSEKTLYENMLNKNIQVQVDDAITLSDIMEEMNEKHRILNEREGQFDSVAGYLVDDRSTAKLVTSEEATMLLERKSIAKLVTQQQALEDIDILFRALKSTYGAYYYFGDEAFETARAELTDWVLKRDTISGRDFNIAVGEAFSFLKDAHANIGQKSREILLRYEYYCFDNQVYYKDHEGYYKMIGNEKWYFKSFTDPRVRMEYTLTLEGEFAYSPVLFCPQPEMKPSEVILENAYGKTMTQALNCRTTYPKAVDKNSSVFSKLEENGIFYISISDFHRENMSDMMKFERSGTDAKKAKLIIFDLRSNGGGESKFGSNWTKNFTGKEAGTPLLFATRYSLLGDKSRVYQKTGTYGTFYSNVLKGKYIKNDIPIIVLMDDKCGSSGESMLHNLRAIENVLVIGSNSAGYQLSGNGVNLFLPNTGVNAAFGTTFQFFLYCDNVEFKGYEPDVWCNPETSLDSVLNMLLHYEKIDVDTWSALKDKI